MFRFQAIEILVDLDAVLETLLTELDPPPALAGHLPREGGGAIKTGDWDFVAIVRVRQHDELARVVTRELAKLEGIERTRSMVAFQQHSRHDLEAMFGLGLQEP